MRVAKVKAAKKASGLRTSASVGQSAYDSVSSTLLTDQTKGDVHEFKSAVCKLAKWFL